MEGFSENRLVKAAFYGIRPAVTALIASAVWGICRVSLFTQSEGRMVPALKTIALCVMIFGFLQVKRLNKLHPAVWILAAAFIGVVFRF